MTISSSLYLNTRVSLAPPTCTNRKAAVTTDSGALLFALDEQEDRSSSYEYSTPEKARVSIMRATQDHLRLILALENGQIDSCHIPNRQLNTVLHRDPSISSSPMFLSQHGSHALLRQDDGHLVVYDVNKAKKVSKTRLAAEAEELDLKHSKAVLSPDAKQMFRVGLRGESAWGSLLDVATGKLLCRIKLFETAHASESATFIDKSRVLVFSHWHSVLLQAMFVGEKWDLRVLWRRSDIGSMGVNVQKHGSSVSIRMLNTGCDVIWNEEENDIYKLHPCIGTACEGHWNSLFFTGEVAVSETRHGNWLKTSDMSSDGLWLREVTVRVCTKGDQSVVATVFCKESGVLLHSAKVAFDPSIWHWIPLFVKGVFYVAVQTYSYSVEICRLTMDKEHVTFSLLPEQQALLDSSDDPMTAFLKEDSSDVKGRVKARLKRLFRRSK